MRSRLRQKMCHNFRMRHHSLRLRVREIVWLLVVIFVVALCIIYVGKREPLSSAETRFVERSHSGLHIVPASCPSSPDYAGWTCSSQTPDFHWRQGCTLYSVPSTVAYGEEARLYWALSNAPSDEYTTRLWEDINISPHIGSVGTRGNRLTPALDRTTTYTLRATFVTRPMLGWEQRYVYTCDATVTVAGPPRPVLTASSICTPDDPQVTLTWSAAGRGRIDDYHLQRCRGVNCTNWANVIAPSASATSPYVDTAVEAGVTYRYRVLSHNHASNLTTDSTPVRVTVCATPPDTLACIPVNVCGTGADAHKVVNSCTAAVIEDCPVVRGAGWTCRDGACVPPEPEGTLKASPSLVQRGDTSAVVWSATDVVADSCTVTENNPDINNSWSSPASASASCTRVTLDDGRIGCATSALFQQTVYTLRCTGLDGSELVTQDTVNIIPMAREL